MDTYDLVKDIPEATKGERNGRIDGFRLEMSKVINDKEKTEDKGR